MALDELAAEPRAHGVIKLTSPELGYRMRVGDVRIKFAIFDEEKRIVVRDIVDRRDALLKRRRGLSLSIEAEAVPPTPR